MQQISYPIIDTAATGENICRLRKERGLTVKELQLYFGFEEPQAIYKWQWGKSLPSVDNLYALAVLFDVSMNDIIVSQQSNTQNNTKEQQDCPAALSFNIHWFCFQKYVGTSPFPFCIPLYFIITELSNCDKNSELRFYHDPNQETFVCMIENMKLAKLQIDACAE